MPQRHKMGAETGGLIMQFTVRRAIAALLSIIPTIFLTGCETTGSSPVAATGSSSAMANNPHPDLPASYRKQIAEFMRTRREKSRTRTERSAGSEPAIGSASALAVAAGPISVRCGLTVSTAGSSIRALATSSASTGRGCSPKRWPAVRIQTSSHSLRPSFSRKQNK
jgi:hypothetical protein